MRHDTLLFDLDGTLADTDALHFEAFQLILAPLGIAMERGDYVARILGRTNEAIMRDLMPGAGAAERARVAEGKEACFRALATRIEPVPGLAALLAWGARNALRTAVVTNAPRANAEQMLAGLGLSARFDVVVIGDELACGKPDPLPYATALGLLGAEPGRAVAFEDSRSGIAAARAGAPGPRGGGRGRPSQRAAGRRSRVVRAVRLRAGVAARLRHARRGARSPAGPCPR
ncbi:MAG: HAD family hydrolase, partial [Alphaproteobacteria bacterium]